MDDDKKMLPLHTTLEKADEGDAGWLYWEGNWRLATIIYDENDEVLYAAVIINDECRPFDVEKMGKLPWFPIHRPPYEGDEMPATHLVSLADAEAGVTLSYRATSEEGREISRKIFDFAQSLLNEKKKAA